MNSLYSRRNFLQTAAGLAFVTLAQGVARAQQTEKLNVVFILADDMGWTGPACYGSDLHETPNIDRLAREGVQFTQAYSASPVCTPTRAALMTGKHPARLNMTIWREAAVGRLSDKGNKPLAEPITETDLALEYETLAESFRNAGYRTIHVGKWHLGAAEYYPETQGFDVNVGGTVWGAPYSYWYPYHGQRTTGGGKLEHRYVPHLEFGEEGEYLTDRLTSEAIRAVERIRDEPFFLYMSYHTPHTPLEGKPELVAHYEKKIRQGMTHTNAVYAAMVHSLDENVGRLLAKLEEWGVAGRTVVVFYSDNGGFSEVRDGRQVTNNAPLRSGKGSLYEGGIRVPLIVKWPGVSATDARCEEPVTTMDLYVTLLEGMGLAAAGQPDGESLLPLLRDPASKLNRDTLYWHYPHYYFNTTPVCASREGDWKLLEYFEDGRLELYNLKDDLGEGKDLAAEAPDVRDRLHQKLRAWREEVGAKLPERNTP